MIEDMAEGLRKAKEAKGQNRAHLRADKNLAYGEVQKALAALTRARIGKVQLAALRSGQVERRMRAEIAHASLRFPLRCWRARFYCIGSQRPAIPAGSMPP